MYSRRDRRLIPVGLLLICVVVALSAGISAHASAPPVEQIDAPDWLQGQVNLTMERFVDDGNVMDAVSSVKWVETTWGQYEAAVGGGSDKSNGNGVYVVIARGKFTSANSGADASPEEAICGSVLVMTYDAKSQRLSTLDLLYSDAGISEGVLGSMADLR